MPPLPTAAGADTAVVAEPWPGDAQRAARRLRAHPATAPARGGRLVWLDSALAFGERGRWSVVAAFPRWVFVARGRRLRLARGGAGDDLRPPARAWSGDPLAALEALLAAEGTVAPPASCPEAPFVGGAVGILGFELGRQIERLPATVTDDLGAPDIAIGWYDAAVLHDRAQERTWLVGRPAAVARLRAALDPTALGATGGAPPGEALPGGSVPTGGGVPTGEVPVAAGPLRAGTARADYLRAVERARTYIARGDIYQVNLSQRFSVPIRGDGFACYERLRAQSPAPFAAYLDLRGEAGGAEVLSSSPERLLLADGALLETRPIKGTRRRPPDPAADPAADARAAAALRHSTKDLAEHVMIVDLERNDLGRVAQPGTVRVPDFAALESFRQVHHLTSTVRARRRPGAGVAEVLRAVFPGGSITGAPKIRALEIIDELEPTARGVYTGSIGYWSATGRADLNIAIRTIVLRGGVAHMQVGGAVVHDSTPQGEYAETLDKARGMARALGVRLPDEEGAAEPVEVPPAPPAAPRRAAPAALRAAPPPGRVP